MPGFLSRSVPLAWLLLVVLAACGLAIVWMLMVVPSPPSNAVVIRGVDDGDLTTLAASVPAASPRAMPTTRRIESPQGASRPTGTISSTIGVYVTGAVSQPGMYTLPSGSRVADAVSAAGGPTDSADMDRINPAEHVSDEQHIQVPAKGSQAQVLQADSTVTPIKQSQQSAATADTKGARIDINSATAKELESLPGIGSVLAGRIVAYRDEHGPFRTVDELKNVPGIKDGLLSRIRDSVTIGQ